MPWTLTDDLTAYAAAVKGLIDEQPERCTVLATVLATLRQQGPQAFGSAPPLLGWWPAEGPVRAAVLQTPPHPLHLTSLPDDAVGELAVALAQAHSAGLGEVNGTEPDATGFARAWSAATGATFEVTMRMRLFRLGVLTPPEPGPAGAARVATPADGAVVRQWTGAFGAETGQGGSASVLDDRLRSGYCILWETGTQPEPVSMASVTPAVAGVARIGQVYTPPALRGRGYGGALTAAATRLGLERGASSIVLFTDLANPISNALYVKLGYQPVEDRVVISLRPG